MFSYPDTQRHRLGPNFDQIPVNCPINHVHTNSRDGLMTINGNGGSAMNYEPNSHGTGPFEDKSRSEEPIPVKGFMGRQAFAGGDIDFE